MTERNIVWSMLGAVAILFVAMASGQNYPNKPIRIVTSGVGGSGDVVARLVAQGMTASWGQQVIVDNRGGFIPGQVVAQASPDGYTLLLFGNTFWIGPFFEKTPFDPVKDFAPITLTHMAPNVLVVYPPLPVTSVKELIALAKAKPGQLNYGASGNGGSAHLAAELFKSMAEVNLSHIPYKAGGLVLSDLIGGHVQLSFATGAAVAPHIKSGRLKALAVTSAQPSALFPGLPTVAASGLPGYESVLILAMFAPAKTPMPIVDRLNQEVVRFLKAAEAKEKFFSAGVETVGSSPAELAAKMESEMARLGKVIKDAGIHVQ